MLDLLLTILGLHVKTKGLRSPGTEKARSRLEGNLNLSFLKKKKQPWGSDPCIHKLRIVPELVRQALTYTVSTERSEEALSMGAPHDTLQLFTQVSQDILRRQ